MTKIKSLSKLRNRLIHLEKKREFEERYMNNPQMITPLAEEIDKVKSEILKHGYRFVSKLRTVKNEDN